MADELFDHRETKTLHQGFHAAAHFAQHLPGLRQADGNVQRFLSGAEQLMHFGSDRAHGNAGSVIPDPAILNHPDVNLDDISVLNDAARPSNAVDHLLIEGNTDVARKTLVVEKGAPATRVGHELGRSGINFSRADPGPHQGDRFLENLGRRVASQAQTVNLRPFAQGNTVLCWIALHACSHRP